MTVNQTIEAFSWELQKRRIKKGGFIEYCKHFGPDLCPGYDFVMAKHHLLMAEELEKAMMEPEYNVMFLMPPGHSKSTYSSILFPSYFLAEKPGHRILACSNTVDLAEGFGRETRNIVSSEFYQHYAGASLLKDSFAALRFGLNNGSTYKGAGVGKAITGQRSYLGLIDDPTKSAEAADSEVQRQSVWEWYNRDFMTRLVPGASQVMAVTRWHEDDLPGRIMNSSQGKYWKVISLPAIAEDNDYMGRKAGEALWPAVYPIEHLLKRRDGYSHDIRTWESLYQQRPTVEMGDYFKRDWIKRINKLPEGLIYYGASDYAVTDGQGDYTVHLIVGYDDKHDDIYVVDVWRDRTTSNVWVEQFLKMARRYKTQIWAEEGGQIIKSLDPFIMKEMDNRKQFVFREQFTSSSNKTVRARAFQAYMAQGKVSILNADWTDAFVRELVSFPTGKHDDQVDACGLIGRMLDEMVMRVEKQPKKVEYEYKSGRIMLPGLKDKIGPQRGNYQRI